jgi:hypothetical protein
MLFLEYTQQYSVHVHGNAEQYRQKFQKRTQVYVIDLDAYI